MIPTEAYGLIGYPLSHSFSASYFNAWFKETRQPACYELFPLEENRDIRAWAESIPALKGFNVTIPYKRRILDFLDEYTPAAREIGAANAVRVERTASGIKLIGNNTDWEGFMVSLREIKIPENAKALILGSGGAAAAAAYALKQLGISCRFVSRNSQDNLHLSYEEITAEILDSHRLIVNAAPWGMFPDIHSFPPLPYHAFTTNHLAYDMVYNPSQTEFMRRAGEAGARTCNGYRMLILQAQGSWAWWQEGGN